MSINKIENFKLNAEFSVILDFIRWAAAFFVVLGHIRSILFCNYDQLIDKNIFIRIFYFFSGIGHEAVIVFFLLSGFLVGGSVLKDFFENRLDLKQYSINRFSRLYCVFIPSLFLTLILDSTGIYFFNQTGVYNHFLDISSIPFNITERLTPAVFIGNLFMLQESYFPAFGSNGPLWSLAYEFWYYFMFFFFISIWSPKTGRIAKLLFALFFILGVIFISKVILLYFLIWISGMAVYWFSIQNRFYLYFILLLFPLTITICRLKVLSQIPTDFIFALHVLLILISLKDIKISLVVSFKVFHKRLADFSYSLYAIHFPLIILSSAILHKLGLLEFQTQPTLTSVTYFFALLVFTYFISYAFAKVTEFKTKRLREFLLNLLNPHKQL